jgi:Uma2 family endonuclease
MNRNPKSQITNPEYQCGTYTDLMVVNGEPEFNGNRNDEILNPMLIVEVLSPVTVAYDRGDKFRKYRSIASFCEYLLVSQTEPIKSGSLPFIRGGLGWGNSRTGSD